MTEGGDEGVQYWRERIQAVASSYNKVLMLGDSMGGTGALLFADLATSIQVFTPQVCSQVTVIRYCSCVFSKKCR